MIYYGTEEKPGPEENNQEILEMFHYIGQNWVKNDETAWCSAFVNMIAKFSEYEFTGKLNARSWMEIGEPTANPKLGTIVVFWRESKKSWKGHVGFYAGENETHVFCLGGNQSNMVKISPYPKSRVLGYRNLKKQS